MTVGELRRRLGETLRTAFADDSRRDSAGLDGRLIVAHVLGCRPDALFTRDDEDLNEDLVDRALALGKRRAAGEPLARLVGQAEFYGLDLHLSAATLIPRPDTETLVDGVLNWVDQSGGRDVPHRLLDLGTGSGAILLALLHELPRSRGVGVDLTPDAVRTAAANAERLGLGDRAAFRVGDWANDIGERFDIIVSNPPYIVRDEVASLQTEVRDHDPMLALDGGRDGLDAYRALLPQLVSIMSPDGAAWLEIGHDQADALRELSAAAGFDCAIAKDLAGRDRVAQLSIPSGA